MWYKLWYKQDNIESNIDTNKFMWCKRSLGTRGLGTSSGYKVSISKFLKIRKGKIDTINNKKQIDVNDHLIERKNSVIYITIMLQMSFFTQVQAFTLYNSGYWG